MKDYKSGFAAIKAHDKYPEEFQTDVQHKMFPKIKKPYFSKRQVLIGWSKTGFNNRHFGNYGNVFQSHLELMQNMGKKMKPIPSITTVCGARGSGKTVLAKRIVEGLLYSGYSVCHLSDIKNEMVDCLQPNRDMAHLLPKEDMPRTLPIKVYKPYFFHIIKKEELPENNEWLSIPFSAINDEILSLAFNLLKGDKRRIILEKYFNESKSMEDLKNMIENGETQTSSVKNLLDMIELAISRKFFSDEYTHDFVEDMNKGFIPVLNLQGYNVDIPSEYYQTYLSVMLTRIEQARISKELKNDICILIDEASKMIPAKKETKAKEKIEYMIDVSRRAGIYMIFAAQETEDMPSKVLMQSKYIFMPPNYDFEKFKDILKNKGFYSSMPNEIYGFNWWQKIKKFMSDLMIIYKGRKFWIKLDNDTKRYEIFSVYPPMCGHEQN